MIRDEEHVARRLQELLGWADYIVESLTVNQRSEPVKRELLERLVGETTLRELRTRAWSLREKLDCVSVEAEFRALRSAEECSRR